MIKKMVWEICAKREGIFGEICTEFARGTYIYDDHDKKGILITERTDDNQGSVSCLKGADAEWFLKDLEMKKRTAGNEFLYFKEFDRDEPLYYTVDEIGNPLSEKIKEMCGI